MFKVLGLGFGFRVLSLGFTRIYRVKGSKLRVP